MSEATIKDEPTQNEHDAQPSDEKSVESDGANNDVEPTSERSTAADGEKEEQPAEETPLSLEEQLEAAQKEAAGNLDRWQRSVAELANFKRRQDEMRKLERNQIKNELLQGVISSLDDIDLAFQNVPDDLDGQITGWVEGFRLVNRKLHKVLDDQFVAVIDTSDAFDPNLHEAVSYEESDDHEEGQIIAELRRGYQIGSYIIRPALVRVAS